MYLRHRLAVDTGGFAAVCARKVDMFVGVRLRMYVLVLAEGIACKSVLGRYLVQDTAFHIGMQGAVNGNPVEIFFEMVFDLGLRKRVALRGEIPQDIYPYGSFA